MTNINTPNIKELDVVVSDIDAMPKHLLFFDTCALLDIVRLPLPERNNPIELHDHLITIKNLAVNNEVICVSSELCIKEYNDHIGSIIASYPQELNKYEKPLNRYVEIINQSGIAGYEVNRLDLNNYHLENYFVDIATAIIDKIVFIADQDNFRNSAHTRTLHKVPPAQKKGEYKDCIIWETFLHLIKGKSSRKEYSFFLSSNDTDYCESKRATTEFHPYLKSEVGTYNAHFALTYTKLFHKLKQYKQLLTIIDK